MKELAPLKHHQERIHEPTPEQAGHLLDLGLHHWRNGEIAPSLAYMREASMVSACADHTEGFSSADIMRILQLTQLRKTQEAEEELGRQHRQRSRGADDDPTTSILRANIRLTQGPYGEARELAAEALARTDRTAPRSIIPVGHLVMATTSLRLCDLRSAMRYARLLSEDSLFGRLPLIGAEAAWIVAQVVEMERGFETAADLLSEVTNSALRSHELLVGHPAAAPSLVRFALYTGDRKSAEQVAWTAQALAAKNRGFTTARTASIHALSLLDEKVDGLLWAATEHIDPWASAWATEDAGIVTAKAEKNQARGVGLLEEALRTYESLGSSQDVARVKAKLRGIHVHRHRPAPAQPSVGTAAGLTATEAKIVDLVSQGLTNLQVANQLYLSRHTVAYHLKSIFSKLSVSSRGQLTSLWAELKLVKSASGHDAAVRPSPSQAGCPL